MATTTVPEFDRYAARYGRTAATKRYRSVVGSHSTSAPLERAEIDHTLLDMMVIDDDTSEDHEETFMAAARVLQQWPHGYHKFLRSSGERFRSEGAEGSGMRQQFEPLYGSLFKGRSWSGHARFLREEFVNFGALHWGHAVVDGKLLGTPRTEASRFVTKSEFARRHQLSKPALERLIAEGEISTNSFAGGKSTRTLVDVEQTSSLGSSKSVVTVREAAARVGLPVSVLQQLRERGVFATRPRAGHKTSWHEEDVDSFISCAFH